jgi:hypothetical protein
MNTASGTTVTDYSGSARNGTTANSPTLNSTGLVAGDSDTAITFNGNYARIAYGSWMNTSNITLEAIIKPADVTAGTNYTIIDRDNYPTSRNFQFRINSSGKIETIFWDTTAALWFTAGTTTLVAGNKYHVTGTYDGINSKVYINGKLEKTVAHTGFLQTNANGAVTVGMYSDGFSQPFNGVIDEVVYYNTALSDDTIAEHASVAGLF